PHARAPAPAYRDPPRPAFGVRRSVLPRCAAGDGGGHGGDGGAGLVRGREQRREPERPPPPRPRGAPEAQGRAAGPLLAPDQVRERGPDGGGGGWHPVPTGVIL